MLKKLVHLHLDFVIVTCKIVEKLTRYLLFQFEIKHDFIEQMSSTSDLKDDEGFSP